MQKELIKRAYKLLDDVTPLKFDCGLICSNTCCKPNAAFAKDGCGMLLLPSEDEIIGDFFPKEAIKECKDENILVCDGKCERKMRPFMCRIFPYYAKIDKDTWRITLKIDPRSAVCCPLATRKKGTRSNIYFHRNARRAVRILMKDEQIRKELIKTCDFCDSLYELYRKMFK